MSLHHSEATHQQLIDAGATGDRPRSAPVVRGPRERTRPAALRGAGQLAARRARHRARPRVARSCTSTTSGAAPGGTPDVTPDEARDFLRDNHRAVLATFRRDGRPQLSPVGAGIDDAGRVDDLHPRDRHEAKNLRRDPRVSSVPAQRPASTAAGARSRATAEIVEQPEAIELLVDYYRRMRRRAPRLGRVPGRDGRDESRVLVRFAIERLATRGC